jgi:hypothetical protein
MLTELAALRQFFDRLDESWEFAIDSRNDDRGFCPVSQLENLRFLYRRFQRGETLVHQVDAPAKLFFGGQLRLAHRIVKLAASQNPSYADLRCDVGEASDHDHGNSLFLDFLPDRSAATCAGSSGGG